MLFARGNAIKYLWRAGLKDDAAMASLEKQIEDLNKAKQYIDFEIERLRDEAATDTDGGTAIS